MVLKLGLAVCKSQGLAQTYISDFLPVELSTGALGIELRWP
jgi:hypothetical protein